MGNLFVLQEYEVDRSSSGFQGNPRNRLEPLIEIQVGVMLTNVYSFRNYWFFRQMGSYSYTKVITEGLFQAFNDDCWSFVFRSDGPRTIQ